MPIRQKLFGGVERGERDVTFSVLCRICDGLTCDIAAVTKDIPYRYTKNEILN
jgi:hypothetical protein